MENQSDFKSERKKEDIQGLLVSLAFHVVIFAFFTVKSIFFSTEPIDYSAAIRVDLVGLPDKLDPSTILPPKQENIEISSPQQKEPQPETKTDVAEKLPPKEIIEKKEPVFSQKPKPADYKNKQNEALNKLKAMAALEKIKKESTQGQKSELPTNYQVKGNILSPGTSLTGIDKINHESYLSDLDQHIKQYWALPEWLATQELKAQVRVQIDRNGNLVAKKVIRSSGNPTYDDYVIETVERSIPFPKPPEKLSAILEVNGVVIGFPE